MPIIGVNKPVVGGIGFTLFLIILFAIQRPGFASLAAQNDAILGPRPTVHHNQTKIEPTIDLTKILPRTKKVAGLFGYNVFDNLYITEGAYAAVTDNPNDIPPYEEVVGQVDVSFRRVGTAMAVDDLGAIALYAQKYCTIQFIFNDPPGLDGYMVYHNNFLAEIFVGGWKVLGFAPPHSFHLEDDESLQSREAQKPLNSIVTGDLPDLPARWMFPKCHDGENWIDGEGMNLQFLMNIAPGATFEERTSWNYRSQTGFSVMLDRVVIIDRKGAHFAKGLTDQWGKMNAVVAGLQSRMDFMDPVREGMIASLQAEVAPADKPVVVYIDNQAEGRKLIEDHHDKLIEALHSLTDIAEVHVAKMKEMDERTRIELLSRATILISVHNDKLLQTLWMPATPISSLIEIFDEGGFAPDWYLYSTMLGHFYYPIHYDHVFENPKTRVTTAGFHGATIRVDGDFIASLVREIIVNPTGENES